MKNFKKDEFIKKYFAESKKLLNDLEKKAVKDIEKTVDILSVARDNKKTIFVMGNGGSAATASHFVEDLSKATIIKGKLRFRAIALTDNTPSILAWGNDTSYERIFIEQLKNLMEPGDIVVGISGSGNSANVIKAIEYANKNGAITIGLCGFDGGKLKKISRNYIHVSSNNMQQVEDIHLLISHLLVSLIRDHTGNMK